jgi:hypothetical protein
VTQKTLLVSVRPLHGARSGLSILYLYRGQRLHADCTQYYWGKGSRDAALLFARRHGFTRVRFDVAEYWSRTPLVSVAELSAVRFPDSELLSMLPRVAWTGGEPPPRKSRGLSKRARGLVREAFRQAMRDSADYWGDGAALCGTTLANARIQWRRAIADAYATIEAAHRARLYKAPEA